jgi:large subunit ribosomal protein L28
MPMQCHVCSKTPIFGHTVSHAHNIRSRKFYPNLQSVRILENGAIKRVRVCTRCLRSGKVRKAIRPRDRLDFSNTSWAGAQPELWIAQALPTRNSHRRPVKPRKSSRFERKTVVLTTFPARFLRPEHTERFYGLWVCNGYVASTTWPVSGWMGI